MQIERFIDAAVNLRDCNHKNVMQVLGIVTDRNLPRAVYSHMEYGDLKQHLCDLKEKVLVRGLATAVFLIHAQTYQCDFQSLCIEARLSKLPFTSVV